MIVKKGLYNCFMLVALINEMRADINKSQVKDDKLSEAFGTLDGWEKIFSNKKYKVADEKVIEDFVDALNSVGLNVSDEAIEGCIEIYSSQVLN